MSASEVVILSATRTAIGTLSGSLSSLPAHELGSVVIVEALKRAGVAADQVSEVIMGQILTAGEFSKDNISMFMIEVEPDPLPDKLCQIPCLVNPFCSQF